MSFYRPETSAEHGKAGDVKGRRPHGVCFRVQQNSLYINLMRLNFFGDIFGKKWKKAKTGRERCGAGWRGSRRLVVSVRGF